jgi:hypothetical protein
VAGIFHFQDNRIVDAYGSIVAGNDSASAALDGICRIGRAVGLRTGHGEEQRTRHNLAGIRCDSRDVESASPALSTGKTPLKSQIS